MDERVRTLLILLDAARPYLEGEPFHDAARELIYLGLDALEPGERQGIILDVLAELDTEAEGGS